MVRQSRSPEPINIGAGEDLAIVELAALIKKVVGYQGRIVWDTSKPDRVPRRLLDSGNRAALGWRPSISLEEACDARTPGTSSRPLRSPPALGGKGLPVDADLAAGQLVLERGQVGVRHEVDQGLGVGLRRPAELHVQSGRMRPPGLAVPGVEEPGSRDEPATVMVSGVNPAPRPTAPAERRPAVRPWYRQR